MAFSFRKMFFGGKSKNLSGKTRVVSNFEFRIRKQDDVKISEVRKKDIDETISLLGKLTEFYEFERKGDFIDHDGWPREAKVSREICSKIENITIEEYIYIEVLVDLGGQNFDRVGRPEWFIEFERDEYEDEPLNAKRKSKSLEGVTVKKARDFMASILNVEL